MAKNSERSLFTPEAGVYPFLLETTLSNASDDDQMPLISDLPCTAGFSSFSFIGDLHLHLTDITKKDQPGRLAKL